VVVNLSFAQNRRRRALVTMPVAETMGSSVVALWMAQIPNPTRTLSIHPSIHPSLPALHAGAQCRNNGTLFFSHSHTYAYLNAPSRFWFSSDFFKNYLLLFFKKKFLFFSPKIGTWFWFWFLKKKLGVVLDPVLEPTVWVTFGFNFKKF